MDNITLEEIISARQNELKCPYRSTVGILQWLSNSRADLSYGTSIASEKLLEPGESDLKNVNEVVGRGKRNKEFGVLF